MTWDVDPVNETVQAVFALLEDITFTVLEVVAIDGDEWRECEEGDSLTRLVRMIRHGKGLKESLARLGLCEA